MFCICMTLTAEISMLLLAMSYAAPMLEKTIAQQQPIAPKNECGRLGLGCQELGGNARGERRKVVTDGVDGALGGGGI
ncbi:uncharacterized protein EAF01_004819 [Botrytis porri]|uniref:uncharacterized protein n=1 Tax=Botrytis porri TaxID=87229 RepID=UPI0019008BD9|nr:uncharacterized protein EAF01_004819 [Botrytis porri]KAF7907232.1 hypothetical protein EAF01_004819 [Botrytis porri]